MAKQKTKPADEPADRSAEKSQPKPARATVEVVMKRDMQSGELELKIGQRVAEVTLEPGISLNYLVDAVRDHLAGPVE